MMTLQNLLSTQNLMIFSIVCIVLVLAVLAYRYFFKKQEKFDATMVPVTEIKEIIDEPKEQAIVNETAAIQATIQANEDIGSVENTPLVLSQNDIYKPVDIDSSKENSFVPPYTN